MSVYGDHDAMRWVGEGRALTRAEGLQWLEVTFANYATRGYGMYALVLKETGAVVGFAGIVHPAGQPQPEVKYAFLRDYWGKGLATEAVVGLLQHAFARHGLAEVMATTAPQNLASQRVLTKAGMQRGALASNDDGTATQYFYWRAPALPD